MSFSTHNLLSNNTNISVDDRIKQIVLDGLSGKPKRLPSWLIFDDLGSEIFNDITLLEEYHPAHCELDIIQTHKKFLTALLLETKFQLLELGAGDGRKTHVLLEHLIDNQCTFEYVPIDISEGAIINLVSHLERQFQQSTMSVTGLVADYFDGLRSVGKEPRLQRFIMFLGSTIGNMDLSMALRFIAKLKEYLNEGDYVMIGFDLMKHPKKLYSAYNDSTGVFEKFNLHLLDVLNRKLGATFKKDYFVHQGHYNPTTHAVESFVYSTRPQTVYFEALEKSFHFDAWESLQTEHSYKYTLAEIESLACNGGYQVVRHLFDSNSYYVDSVWEVGG